MLKYFRILYEYNKQHSTHIGKRNQVVKINKSMIENKQKQQVTENKIRLKLQSLQYANVIKIQARNLQDNKIYFGEIDPDTFDEPNFQFLMNHGKYEILSQEQNYIKIKIQTLTIQFITLQKLSIQQLKETLKSSLQREPQLQYIIKAQNEIIQTKDDIIEKQRKLFQNLKKELQEFKSQIMKKYGYVNKSIIEEQKMNQMISSDTTIKSDNQQNQLVKKEMISAVQMVQNPQIEQNPNTCQNDNQNLHQRLNLFR